MSTQAERLPMRASEKPAGSWRQAPVIAVETVTPSTPPNPRANGWPKRALDIAIALPLLVATSPLFLVLIIMIRSHDGGSAFFKQRRIGYGGEEFECYKFRTMVVNAPDRLQEVLERDPAARAEWDRDQKLRNDPRVTRLGAFLRRSSLDELPQLINILRGEMSIVGPRPIVRQEVKKYGDFFGHYTAVRPGVTGLWQVMGRNDTTYEERVRLDAAYATSWSFKGDLWILLRTIPAVLLSRGAY